MRIRTLCLCLLTLGTIGALPAAGQCLPDCPETPFGPLQNHTITLPGNCQIEVTYASRHACWTWQDLYIESIKTVPSPPSPACQSYWTMSAKDLLWLVTEQMAEDNPMGFTKPTSGCASDWRVIKGACWFRSFDPTADRYTSSYCDGSSCCLERYEICYDDCGNVSCFEPQSTYATGGVCDPTHPGGCEPVCGDPSWSEGGSCP